MLLFTTCITGAMRLLEITRPLEQLIVCLVFNKCVFDESYGDQVTLLCVA